MIIQYFHFSIIIRLLLFIENRAENFGRQKCWGSVGWGFFSIFIGWLVDMVSDDKNEINYSPVFYSGIILTVFNLFVSAKIQVCFIISYHTLLN